MPRYNSQQNVMVWYWLITLLTWQNQPSHSLTAMPPTCSAATRQKVSLHSPLLQLDPCPQPISKPKPCMHLSMHPGCSATYRKQVMHYSVLKALLNGRLRMKLTDDTSQPNDATALNEYCFCAVELRTVPITMN
jgi:hypothetical protein